MKSIYNDTPYFIKKLYALRPFSILNGKAYREWRERLKKPENVDRNLLEIVKYGFINFKLYRKLYDAVGYCFNRK